MTRAIDFAAATSLTAMFFTQANRFGDQPFLRIKRNGAWQAVTWRETATTVTAVARGLVANGLRPGERAVIASESRPEWCIADLAIMAAGGITVPTYITNTVADYLHVFNDCQPKIIITSSGKIAWVAMQAAAQMRNPPKVVLMDPEAVHQNPGLTVIPWAALQAGDAPFKPHPHGPRDPACIIYTSGTGGVPRGVVQAHGSIIANCRGAYEVLKYLKLKDQETFLSFLPLSHAYEHTAGQFFPISLGASIWYAEGVEALTTNLVEARPTLITAVPRLYEVLRDKMIRGVKRQGGSAEVWFNRTLMLGLKRQTSRLSLTERITDLLCTLLVRRKIAQRFGGRLKAFVSGGAPLNPEVGRFFSALGVCILQGYGQTEASPVISVNVPGQENIESVGPPLEGVELKIAEDGEILVRGDLVMIGYWNDPEATANTVDAEGWLHTGDIGVIDSAGRLRITDRKKDLIVNSGGDNVSPQRVEGFLTLEPEIAQAMVYGDKRPHLVALLVPDVEFIDRLIAEHGLADAAAALAHPAMRAGLGEAVARVNRGLAQHEKIRRFAIADEMFGLENGMLTVTLKIRRHVILGKYGPTLIGLYEDKSS